LHTRPPALLPSPAHPPSSRKDYNARTARRQQRGETTRYHAPWRPPTSTLRRPSSSTARSTPTTSCSFATTTAAARKWQVSCGSRPAHRQAAVGSRHARLLSFLASARLIDHASLDCCVLPEDAWLRTIAAQREMEVIAGTSHNRRHASLALPYQLPPNQHASPYATHAPFHGTHACLNR